MKILVIGAGQMGSGIAQVAACSGFNTVLTDISEDQLKKAHEGCLKSVEKLASKDKADPKQFTDNFSTSSKPEGTFDLIVEAVNENLELKHRIVSGYANHLAADGIFASNTSSISITKIARAVPDPTRFVGLHFMNPVPLMPLVEIISGLETSEETLQQALKIARELGKQPVLCKKDSAGFIVNRVLMPMINEACFAYYEGIASVEDIDQAMKLGCNQPMGPLTLADFIGLDTCLYILETLHTEIGEDKYRPCPILRQYVDAGKLGKKSGSGFYDYSK